MAFMNNGKAFPSVNGRFFSNPCHSQLHLLPDHWQAERYWISSDLRKPNLFENNLNNSRNDLKSENKKNRSISLLVLVFYY